ncbi:MFS transporter [Salmonella enterica subsp. enterica serovar Worthington]|nr:MFS transporter [Salmonella enterica subsp. enterica serovar Worthington]
MRVGGVITNDPTQRISLQSRRFVLATAGGMLSTVLMMPLVKLIGGENKALGFGVSRRSRWWRS